MNPTLFNDFTRIGLDFLFPPTCLICRKVAFKTRENSLCEICLIKLIKYETFICGYCGARFAENRKKCHPQCGFYLAPATLHESPIKDWIHRLKYRGERGYARPIAALMTRYLNNLKFDFTGYVLMPVPLHKKREQARGFNQSAEIAELIGETLGLNVETRAGRRQRPARPQIELKSFAARIKNIEGGFSIVRPEFVKNRKVIIIDDVFTSGGTCRAFAMALKKAKAKQIVVAVAAKAL